MAEIEGWSAVGFGVARFANDGSRGADAETLNLTDPAEIERMIAEAKGLSDQIESELKTFRNRFGLGPIPHDMLSDLMGLRIANDLGALAQNFDDGMDLREALKQPTASSDSLKMLQAGTFLEPLYQRYELLALVQTRMVRRLWVTFALVSVTVAALVWWAWLFFVLPGFRKAGESAKYLRATLDSLGDGVIVLDPDLQVLDINREGRRILGMGVAGPCPADSEKSAAIWLQEQLPPFSIVTLPLRSDPNARREARIELPLKNGGILPIFATAAPITRNGSGVFGLTIVFRDMTTEERMWRQIQSAERLRNIDEILGGVAHDFNNVLANIVSSADLMRIGAGSSLPLPIKDEIDNILRQSQVASDLTKQLMNFTAQKSADFRVFNLGNSIKSVVDILNHTKAKSVKLDYSAPLRPLLVSANQSLIESTVMNLLLNAIYEVDAGSGVVQVVLEEVEILDDREIEEYIGLTPGPFASITVGDNGPGIDAQVQDHIFEPFFTTKPAGKGSGLGLAAAFGTIKDHKGTIRVQKGALGGAEFTILLPLADGRRNTAPK